MRKRPLVTVNVSLCIYYYIILYCVFLRFFKKNYICDKFTTGLQGFNGLKTLMAKFNFKEKLSTCKT